MTGQPTETKRLPKAIRDALPEPARPRRGSTPRTCRRSSSTRSGRRSATASSRSPRPASSARSCSSTRAGSSRRPRPRDDRRGRERLGGHDARGRVPQRLVVQREERRADAALPGATSRLAFVMVDEPQGFKSSVPPLVAVTSRPRGRALPRPEPRDLGGARASRPPSASATCTRARSWRSGRRGSAQAATEAKDTHVLMNNCYANYGSTNAREIAALLAGDLPDDSPGDGDYPRDRRNVIGAAPRPTAQAASRCWCRGLPRSAVRVRLELRRQGPDDGARLGQHPALRPRAAVAAVPAARDHVRFGHLAGPAGRRPVPGRRARSCSSSSRRRTSCPRTPSACSC